jgi:hypothetical protein
MEAIVTNYLKIVGTWNHRVVEVVTFDDCNLADVERAWREAKARRDELPSKRKLVLWKPVPLSGDWSALPITFVSGLRREYASAFAQTT